MERSTLLAEEAKLLEDPAGGALRLSAVYARLNEIDAYTTAEARAAAILSGLSFDTEAQLRPTKSFSGGWRMRVALARALFIVPDLAFCSKEYNWDRTRDSDTRRRTGMAEAQPSSSCASLV